MSSLSKFAYKCVSPSDVSVARFFGYLTEAVVPRPIALVSSCDKEGRVNLSPFSFFNAFSANPPILIFSPSRSVRDNSTKHTLDNVKEVPEAVVHIVSYAMVEQTSLSSTSYAKGVNEFLKSGLTQLPSEQLQPPRVAEAPVAFECKVREVISLGDKGGAGNLVLCEVLLVHIRKDVMDEKGRILPLRLDPVARLGGDTYARLSKDVLFSVKKPLETLGVGVDALPKDVRLSPLLTGNELGILGNVEQLPSATELKAFASTAEGRSLKAHLQQAKTPKDALHLQHKAAQTALQAGDLQKACCILLLTMEQ